jgi:hypothetical protein
MSTHHGEGSRIVKCARCSKPFRVTVSRIRRRRGVFCTRECWLATMRSLVDDCAARHDQHLRDLTRSAS